MKNRIMAILVVILMCFSMITPVFADTSNLKTVNGEVYQISYWHPAGYPDATIVRTSDTGWCLYYFEEGGYLKLNQTGYGRATTKGVRCFLSSEKEVTDILFNGNTEQFINNQVAFTTTSNLHGTTHDMYMSVVDYYNIDNAYVNITSPTKAQIDAAMCVDSSGNVIWKTFENYYVSWYYNTYKMYPPLVGLGGDEDVEFMAYPNYLILQQPLQVTHSGGGVHRPEEGEDYEYTHNTGGYVETVDDVTLYSEDGTYIYVVVSSKEPSANLHNAGVFETLGAALQLLLTEKGQRNNYDWLDHQGYLMKEVNNENVTRYYFGSLTEASKFVLYGTAGAQYQYKDETHYGYGYTDCLYNNYEVNYFGVRPVPEFQYPLGRMRIVLRWHNADVYDREYIMIDCNYIPYGVLIGTDYKLRIHQKLDPEFYQAWKIDGKNSDIFDPCDWSVYEEIDKYDENTLTKFQLYSPKLEEMYVSTSWDVIYSTHSIFSITKDGDNYSAGDISTKPTIETSTNSEGKWIYNHLTDEYFKNGTEKEFVKQQDGTYANEDGEILDPSTLVSDQETWLKSVLENSLALGHVANIIDQFTTILDYATEQVKPLTALFAAVFASFPTLLKQILTFTILALILGRFIRRR